MPMMRKTHTAPPSAYILLWAAIWAFIWIVTAIIVGVTML